MAAVGEDHFFVVPKKEIYTMEDMDKWIKSDAYQEYVGFVESMNDAVRGKNLNYPVEEGPIVTAVLNVLKQMDQIVDETPLIDQPQRFGNKAFATFYQKFCAEVDYILTSALPAKFHKAVPEMSVYLTESVGNSTRIDYGSGHELSFVMFMYCLFRIGALDCNSVDDKLAAVNKIFLAYLDLVRKLQTKFNMEPAGSHGVWSLDDFQFIPFIWGSSQFVGNPKIEPAQFTDENIVQRQSADFMFLGCIQYIMQVKSGPFHEHSNQLYNISGTATWTKVNQGLIKMYKGEVLAKFPVVQHILFGSLLSIAPFDSSKKRPVAQPDTGRPLPSLGRALLRNAPPPPPPTTNNPTNNNA